MTLPKMTSVSEAVILMAGEGSRLRQGYIGQARLRGSDSTFLKPFVPLLGRPLISYALDALIRAGIKTRQLRGRLRKRAHDRSRSSN